VYTGRIWKAYMDTLDYAGGELHAGIRANRSNECCPWPATLSGSSWLGLNFNY
jgi:hypothetical protein